MRGGHAVALAAFAFIVARPVVGQQCSAVSETIAVLGAIEDPVSPTSPIGVSIAGAPFGWIIAEPRYPVAIYAPSGAFTALPIREGEGPRELLRPERVAVDPTDTTWVSDSRGRAVLIDPSGTPVRTVSHPELRSIVGFSPSGLPFALLSAPATDGAIGRQSPLFAQFFTRNGAPLHRVGLGGEIALAYGVRNPPSWVAEDEHTMIAPGGAESWMKRVSDEEEVVVPLASVRSRLTALGYEEDAHIGASAVVSDGSGGFWVLGGVRVLGREEEARLAARIQKVEGYSRDVSAVLRAAPSVRHAVWDGVLSHVGPDGALDAVLVTETLPERLLPGPFSVHYTDHPETGLIRAHISSIALTCPGRRQE